MNIYKISCHSDCGTYFGAYLQSVTLLAKDEPSAIQFLMEWMKNPMNPKFIFPYERTKVYKSKGGRPDRTYTVKWEVALLLEGIGDKEPQVIDTHEDSDY